MFYRTLHFTKARAQLLCLSRGRSQSGRSKTFIWCKRERYLIPKPAWYLSQMLLLWHWSQMIQNDWAQKVLKRYLNCFIKFNIFGNLWGGPHRLAFAMVLMCKNIPFLLWYPSNIYKTVCFCYGTYPTCPKTYCFCYVNLSNM